MHLFVYFCHKTTLFFHRNNERRLPSCLHLHIPVVSIKHELYEEDGDAAAVISTRNVEQGTPACRLVITL